MENFPFDPTKHNEDDIIAYFQGMDTIEKEMALKKLKTLYLTSRCPTARNPNLLLKKIIKMLE